MTLNSLLKASLISVGSVAVAMWLLPPTVKAKLFNM
jgi:hypothetical protein